MLARISDKRHDDENGDGSTNEEEDETFMKFMDEMEGIEFLRIMVLFGSVTRVSWPQCTLTMTRR